MASVGISMNGSTTTSMKRIASEDDASKGELIAARQNGILIAGPGALRAVAQQAKLSRLTVEQQEMINRAKKYAMEQSIKCVLVKQTLAHQQQQQKTLQKHQALVLMCRVYVGSISFELREDSIRSAFSAFGPIKTINMSFDPVTQKHKGFAFVEFEIPEAAQLALDQMNGVLLGGRNIKVGRPSNMPQAAPIIEQITEEAKNFNRVYVSSIHPDLCEQDVESVFEAFGKIRTCVLATTGIVKGKHKGYGYIEYETQQAALDAIASMNMFDLGGQFLRVGRAITPPTSMVEAQILNPNLASAVAAAAAKIQSIDSSNSSLITKSGSATAAAGIPLATLNGIAAIQPVLAANAPGIITGVTVNPAVGTVGTPTLVIPPPTLITQLPLKSPALLSQTGPNKSEVKENNGMTNNNNSTPSTTAVRNGNSSTDDMMDTASQVEAAKANILAALRNATDAASDEVLSLQQQENIMIKGTTARHRLMQKLMRKIESRIVILRNMVGVEDIDDDLESEVTDECGKFGLVNRVIIYQERQSEEEDAEVLVKIFVEFQDSSSAVRARDQLNGRYFGGRTVKAELYDQTLYDDQDLSG